MTTMPESTILGKVPAVLAKGSTEKVTRFSIHQIIQHATLMTSFTLLAITGLPMKFHSLAISQWWIGVWGGIEVTRSVHHYAAWVIIGACVYHLGYILYSTLVQKKPFSRKMFPNRQDAVQLVQEISYYLGRRKERPQFDRFSWKEKFDYWAVFWGMVMIGASGLIMMFPVFFTNFLPGWSLPTALIMHGDEAVLAVAWIFVFHFFFNHLSPGLFPLNTSIFTGKVPKERYRREHPLEYDKLK